MEFLNCMVAACWFIPAMRWFLPSQDRRASRGKPAAGQIRINLWREGTQLSVEVQDDGGGLDFDAIRPTAIKRGLMAQDAEIGDQQAAQFRFMPGLTTAVTLTQDAARGVGMDVVAAAVKRIGGPLYTSSQHRTGQKGSAEGHRMVDNGKIGRI